MRVAKLSKKHGVERYIFASTCSVYGFQNKILNEDSDPMPLEAYSESKIMAEREILPLKSEKFYVSVLRFATAYGLTQKMRFDLIVNGMTLALYKIGKIMVMRPRSQCRPVVHLRTQVRQSMTIEGRGRRNKQLGTGFNYKISQRWGKSLCLSCM